VVHFRDGERPIAKPAGEIGINHLSRFFNLDSSKRWIDSSTGVLIAAAPGIQ
jgi:hypothetical protein